MRALRHALARRLVQLAALIESEERAAGELRDFAFGWNINAWARIRARHLKLISRA